MRVFKLFLISVFSFFIFSCNGMYNQGDTSLEISLPGSSDSGAKYIDGSEYYMGNGGISDSVYVVKLEGPVTVIDVIDYGEKCLFENLKSGKYKIIVENYDRNPYESQQVGAQIYGYGEKDISLLPGKNNKTIDIYSLTMDNISDIKGAKVQIRIFSPNGELPEYEVFSYFDPNWLDLEDSTIVYKGGYTEDCSGSLNFWDGFEREFNIYKNGKLVYSYEQMGDFTSENTFPFYVREGGYTMDFIFTKYDNPNAKIKFNAPVTFALEY